MPLRPHEDVEKEDGERVEKGGEKTRRSQAQGTRCRRVQESGWKRWAEGIAYSCNYVRFFIDSLCSSFVFPVLSTFLLQLLAVAFQCRFAHSFLGGLLHSSSKDVTDFLRSPLRKDVWYERIFPASKTDPSPIKGSTIRQLHEEVNFKFKKKHRCQRVRQRRNRALSHENVTNRF